MKTIRYIITMAYLVGLAMGQKPNNLYKSAENKTYFLETRHKFNWYESWMECIRNNMTFLSIDSPQKSQEITNMIALNFPEPDKPLLYIGANDLGQAKHFDWISTGKEVTYTNWNEFEPNNYNNSEHCVHIGLYEDGTWNDVDCLTKLGYICEAKLF